MPVTTKQFVHAIDVFCVSKGATNRRPMLPTAQEIRQAKETLPAFVQSYLIACNAVNGSFPAVQSTSGETNDEFINRIRHDSKTNSKLWRTAILNGAEFWVPNWVTGSLIQLQEWQLGPGHIADTGIVKFEQRVHIEASYRKKPDSDVCWYVVYPRCIERFDGSIEIEPRGLLNRNTVNNSEWRICLGWPNNRGSRSPLRGGAVRPEGEVDSHEPQPGQFAAHPIAEIPASKPITY